MGATGRSTVISFLGAYHGNTYGALSLSGVSLEMRRGFGPVVPEIYHVPFPDSYRPPPGVDAAAQNMWYAIIDQTFRVRVTAVVESFSAASEKRRIRSLT